MLSPRVAAVELLNILRPTVAVSVFITFTAHALHQLPACRQNLQADDGYLECFVQEVRRFYPFFPAVRSEEHTSELQSLMRISYAVFCLKKKNNTLTQSNH